MRNIEIRGGLEEVSSLAHVNGSGSHAKKDLAHLWKNNIRDINLNFNSCISINVVCALDKN